MTYRLTIFDLDGTLVNSIPDIARSLNEVLAARDFPTHPEANYLGFVGNGARKIVERAAPPGTPSEEISKILAEFNTCYARHCCEHTFAYDGIPALLQRLNETDGQLAVLSNKPNAMTRDVVRHCFPSQPFATVAGASPDYPLKPDPAQLQHIADALNIPLEQTRLVGDSDTDCLTAAHAPCRFIGVTWGYRSRETLTQHGATLLAENPKHLESLLIP